MRPALAVVLMIVVIVAMAMIVAVVMPVSMVMGGVGVLIGQEVRVDVENGIQVEAADVDDGLQVHFAEVDRRDRRARVHVHQAVAQRFVVGFVDQVALGDQDAVGEADLLLRFDCSSSVTMPCLASTTVTTASRR